MKKTFLFLTILMTVASCKKETDQKPVEFCNCYVSGSSASYYRHGRVDFALFLECPKGSPVSVKYVPESQYLNTRVRVISSFGKCDAK